MSTEDDDDDTSTWRVPRPNTRGLDYMAGWAAALEDLRAEMLENAQHESGKPTDFARGAAFAFREACHAINARLAPKKASP